ASVARRLAMAAAALALLLASAACGSGPAAPAPVPATYYLALGDSLARGVQPDAAGTSVETSAGYPQRVYAALTGTRPGLRLVQLGCPGETTGTLAHGDLCHYPGGSQLAAAESFLRARRGHITLVTLDIGANDLEWCADQAGARRLAPCLAQVPRVASRLSAILGDLRAAAGPGVRIVGMNYYLPVLAEWRHGLFGQLVARGAARLLEGSNDLLDQAYAKAGDPVADVAAAFDTGDFGHPLTVPGLGSLPRNVARICQWTWECAPPPRGPNQHANRAGYQVIADAFVKASGLVPSRRAGGA
ncbi:MAG TPA: SGNH/GDSL hydrolase family protein, partial [Trebonia sp.]|nr:SGNH/GDSL hydrolase family protein [Trebonia sp.]